MRLFLAAFCYLTPFFIPTTWPLSWLFPAFLYSALCVNSLSALALWSITAAFFQLLPICAALIAMASGPLWMRLIGPFIFVGYVSGYFFGWLTSTRFILKKHSCLISRLTIWTVSLWLFLLSLEYLFLWPFGRMEGVPFFNPLLPMASLPSMLSPLYYLPYPLVLLWFCIITSIIAGLFESKKKQYAYYCAALIAPWIIIAWQTPRPTPPTWLSYVGHLPLSLPESLSLDAGQAMIYHELNQLLQKHSSLKLVIMPESSWNGSALSNYPNLEWLVNHPIENLIIGSFAQENKAYYNCLYWYQKGLPIKRCEKRHAIPYAERITLNAKSLCTSLYFKKSPPIYPSKKQRIPLHIPGIERLTPYICSDLYCNNWPDNDTPQTLLVTANDSWFMPHFQILMALAAQWRAAQWMLPMLYIAYHHAGYFDQYGNTNPIATTSALKSGLFFDKVQKKDNL